MASPFRPRSSEPGRENHDRSTHSLPSGPVNANICPHREPNVAEAATVHSSPLLRPLRKLNLLRRAATSEVAIRRAGCVSLRRRQSHIRAASLVASLDALSKVLFQGG
jgi:hypothetical protein